MMQMRILLLAALVGFVSAVDCPDGTFPSKRAAAAAAAAATAVAAVAATTQTT